MTYQHLSEDNVLEAIHAPRALISDFISTTPPLSPTQTNATFTATSWLIAPSIIFTLWLNSIELLGSHALLSHIVAVSTIALANGYASILNNLTYSFHCILQLKQLLHATTLDFGKYFFSPAMLGPLHQH